MPARIVLVVPCYNEAGRLAPEPFLQALADHDDLGLLFVDDGSTDGTRAVLDGIVLRAGERARVLALPRNAGKAAAVQAGIAAALATPAAFAGFWDADLSTPLTALPGFMAVFEARPGVEIVMGARVTLLGWHVRRSLLRHYCGRVFATAASLVLGIGVYDTQCGAKIFRATDSVRAVFRAPFQSKWIFDVEILSRYVDGIGAANAGARIYELPLERWTAVPGSRLTLRHAVQAIWDLARIWRK